MWSSDRHRHHRCRDRQDALPQGILSGPSPAGDMPLRAGGCETLLQMDLCLRVPRSGGPSPGAASQKTQDGGGHGLGGLKGIPPGPCHALCVMARPRSGEGRRSDASHQGRSPGRFLKRAVPRRARINQSPLHSFRPHRPPTTPYPTRSRGSSGDRGVANKARRGRPGLPQPPAGRLTGGTAAHQHRRNSTRTQQEIT